MAMSTSVKSGDKIAYCKESAELFLTAKRDLSKTCDELYTLANNIKMAMVDRAYNTIQNLASTTANCIDTTARGMHDKLLEPLSKDQIRGEQSVNAALKGMDTLSSIFGAKLDIPEIEVSVIADRGLDENWTESNQAAFKDACAKFIAIRYRVINGLGDITKKYISEETKDAYMGLGKAAEDIMNTTVQEYNKLKSQLEEAGIMLAEDIATAEGIGSGLKSSVEVKGSKSIIGNDNLKF